MRSFPPLPSRYRLRITFAASSQDDFVAQSLLEGIKTQIDNKYPDVPDRHPDGIWKRGCIGGKRRKDHAEEKIRSLGAFKILTQQLVKSMSRAVPVQDFSWPIVEHRLHTFNLAP